MIISLTIQIESKIETSWILPWEDNIILVLLFYRSVVRTCWVKPCLRIGTVWEVANQWFLIWTIKVSQLYIFNLDIVLIPVVLVFSVFNDRLRSKSLQNIRTIIKNGRRFYSTKVFSFWFQKFFVNRKENSHSRLGIPITFWLVKSVLDRIVIDSLDANRWKVIWLTLDIGIQAFDRALDDWKSFWFFICCMLQTSDKVLSFNLWVFFTVWCIPFSIFAKLIGIGQTILWNSPVFRNRWNQITILIIFQKTIDQIWSHIRSRCPIGVYIVQGIRVSQINIRVCIAGTRASTSG